jgi:uncharacterized protein (DUF3084 family)
MSTWLTGVLTTAGGALGGGGLIVNAFARRPVIRADAAARLNDESLKWVEQFQEDAREAQQEAREARSEATAARREAAAAHADMRAIRREADWLLDRLEKLHRAILDPSVSRDRLKAMVAAGPHNGAGHENGAG